MTIEQVPTFSHLPFQCCWYLCMVYDFLVSFSELCSYRYQKNATTLGSKRRSLRSKFLVVFMTLRTRQMSNVFGRSLFREKSPGLSLIVARSQTVFLGHCYLYLHHMHTCGMWIRASCSDLKSELLPRVLWVCLSSFNDTWHYHQRMFRLRRLRTIAMRQLYPLATRLGNELRIYVYVMLTVRQIPRWRIWASKRLICKWLVLFCSLLCCFHAALRLKTTFDCLIWDVSHRYLDYEFRQALRHDEERWALTIGWLFNYSSLLFQYVRSLQ